MAKHALLSASGAHRWLECTPSALLELQFPQSTSEYAEEGTAAHELCELTARYFLGEVSEMDFENRHDELAKGPYYNAEMQECANDYARFVTEKTKAAQESCEDAFTELEVRVDFSKYVKDGFGTGDCIIVADKVLEIVDFKYGKGVRVEATGNPQMKLYALGALLKYNTLFDIDSVRMTIFQPRLSGVQSSDEITVKELLEWAEKYVKPRASQMRFSYLSQCQDAMRKYKLLVEYGVDNDSAGYLAPQGLRNVLIISATPYQWKHMISQRTCRRNTAETRYVMLRLWEELYELAPALFSPETTGPYCMKGKCLEGKMACGTPLSSDLTPHDILERDFPLCMEVRDED